MRQEFVHWLISHKPLLVLTLRNKPHCALAFIYANIVDWALSFAQERGEFVFVFDRNEDSCELLRLLLNHLAI